MTLQSKVRYVLRNTMQPFLGWVKWNEMQFRLLHGYKPNFKNPSTFLEYIHYLKYFGLGAELAPFVDKSAVKEFVRDRVGDEYVIPTAKLLYPNEDIIFSDLPPRWIAKSAHAAGWNHIHNGGHLNEQQVRVKFRRWLRSNYYTISGETNYRYIAPKLVFEPLISDEDEDLKDYKIWCFSGEPLLVGVHGNRRLDPKGQIFNLDWEPSNWKYPGISAWDTPPPRPCNFNLLMDLARTLSQDFPFVRVDLYDGACGVFFGELTFTPGDGNNIRIPKDEDLTFGKKVLRKNSRRFINVSYRVELNH